MADVIFDYIKGDWRQRFGGQVTVTVDPYCTNEYKKCERSGEFKESKWQIHSLKSSTELWTGDQGSSSDYPQIIPYLVSLQRRHTFNQNLSQLQSAINSQQIWMHRLASSSEWKLGNVWERGKLQTFKNFQIDLYDLEFASPGTLLNCYCQQKQTLSPLVRPVQVI